MQSPIPIGRHSIEASPCYTAILHAFRWKIQNLALQQWHRLGKPPVNNHIDHVHVVAKFQNITSQLIT